MKRYLSILILALILILGAYIRIAPIVSGDVLFLFDQGRDLWDVKKIVFERDFTLIGPFTGLAGLFNGAYHYYLLALPIWLGNGDPMWGYYFNALVSIVGIVGCYWFGTRMHGKIFGLCVATIFAFAKASVGVTVFFWNPNMIPAMMVPFVYFMWVGLIQKKAWGLVGAGFFGGIMGNVEAAYGIWLMPVYVVGILLFWPKAWRAFYSWAGMAAYALHFVPQLMFDLRNDFLMTKSVFGFLLGKNLSLGVSIGWPERLWTRLNELFYATGGAMSADELMILNYCLAAMVGIMVMVSLLEKFWHSSQKLFLENERRELWFYSYMFVVYLICFLAYGRVAWQWYWIGLQTVYYFLFAYLCWILWQKPWSKRFAFGPLLVWLVLTIPFYFRGSAHLEDQPGRYKYMMLVVNYIFEQKPEGDFAVYTYTPPIYDYAYSYLIWWQAHKRGVNVLTDYEYSQGEERRRNSFIILEPVGQEKLREVDGFLKTKTPPGEDRNTIEMPGKITVISRDVEL